MESHLIDLSSGKGEDRFKSLSPLEERLVDILKEGPLTRDQLVKKILVPRTTIYDGLKKLIVRNEVRKYPISGEERSRGRPKVMFELVSD